MSRRDWRTMTPGDFSADAAPAPLFALEPASVPAPVDGCGTGDLLELIGPDIGADGADMPMPSGRIVE